MFDGQVGVGADDGFWREGNGINVGAANLGIGYSGSQPYNSWARWTNVTIPGGATIDLAHITVVETNNGPFTVKSDLFFEDSDDAVAPTTYQEGDALVRTTSFTPWDDESFVLDAVTDSPSIVDIVQEICDRGGWNSGQSMMLIWDDGVTPAVNFYRPYSYENTPAKAIKLHVEYTT